MKMPWQPPPPESLLPLVAALETRLVALEQRMAHLTADAGLVRVEWSEVLDKISHWASRQSGRESRKAKEALDSAAQDAPGPTIVPSQGISTKADLRRTLSQRQNGGSRS